MEPKITAHDQPSTLDKISATFESYWNSHEFAPYSENDVQKLSQALSAENTVVKRRITSLTSTPITISRRYSTA